MKCSSEKRIRRKMATSLTWPLLTLLVLAAWRTALCEESSILDGAKILTELESNSDNGYALLDGGYSTIA